MDYQNFQPGPKMTAKEIDAMVRKAKAECRKDNTLLRARIKVAKREHKLKICDNAALIADLEATLDYNICMLDLA